MDSGAACGGTVSQGAPVDPLMEAYMFVFPTEKLGFWRPACGRKISQDRFEGLADRVGSRAPLTPYGS